MEDEGRPDGWIRKAMDDAIAKKREAERMRDEQVKNPDNADRELLRMKAAKPFREILAREQKRVRAAERRLRERKRQRRPGRPRSGCAKSTRKKIYKARRDATDYKRLYTAPRRRPRKNRAYRGRRTDRKGRRNLASARK